MKKIAIIAALLASSSFLSACTNSVEKSEESIGTWETIEAIDTGDIIETSETLDTVVLTGDTTTTGNAIATSGSAIVTAGNQETIVKIKTLIDNRKKELALETGSKKELTEKDIELLESIVNELSQKK